ncbi:MAG: glycoside hydrolase N-terminal domain-containing protein [Thermomicrobiales bacterium]
MIMHGTAFASISFQTSEEHIAPTSLSAQPSDPNRSLWNDRPTRQWLAAFPIGNGRIGVMVFGGIEQERFA